MYSKVAKGLAATAVLLGAAAKAHADVCFDPAFMCGVMPLKPSYWTILMGWLF